MTELASTRKPRREFRNINAITDLTTYRLPLAGLVSILHRISGAIMFLLMPFIIWMFDYSVSSAASFQHFSGAFSGGMGILLKLIALALIWAFLHHFIAGIRHLWMDMNHHAVEKNIGTRSAQVTLGLSIFLTLVLMLKLFGAY